MNSDDPSFTYSNNLKVKPLRGTEGEKDED